MLRDSKTGQFVRAAAPSPAKLRATLVSLVIPNFPESDRWFLSALGCWLSYVISPDFFWWFLSVFGAVGYFWSCQFPFGLCLLDPLFAAWVAFVGLCGRERSECSRF